LIIAPILDGLFWHFGAQISMNTAAS